MHYYMKRNFIIHDKKRMHEHVINCIPSKTLREHLRHNPIELSAMQEATIINEYAEGREKNLPVP